MKQCYELRHAENARRTEDAVTSNLEVTVPQDQGYSWCVLVGCFLGMSLMAGITMRSVGILYLHIPEYFDVTHSEAAWIPGILSGLALGLGPVTGVCVRRFQTRWVVLTASMLATAGFSLSAFVTRVEYLYLTMGCLLGTSVALSYLSCVHHVTLYFTARRSLAIGVGMGGSGVGGFIAGPLTTYLLEAYSLRGTFLIMGGVLSNLAVSAMLFRPTAFYTKQRRKNVSRGSYILQDYNIPYVSNIPQDSNVPQDSYRPRDSNIPQGYNVPRNSYNPRENIAPQKIAQETTPIKSCFRKGESTKKITYQKGNKIKENTAEPAEKDEQFIHSLKSLLTNYRYLILIFAATTNLIGFFSLTTILLPSWASESGLPVSHIGVVVGIFSGSDAIGRVSAGVLDSLKVVRSERLGMVLLGVSAAGTGLLPLLGTSLPGLSVLVIPVGLGIGGMIPLSNEMICQIVPARGVPLAMGIMSLLAFPQIFIQHGAAVVYEYSGSWALPIFALSGLLLLGCASLLLLDIISSRKEYSTNL